LGAGCSVIAHNNHFNRWVAGDAAVYFDDEHDCAKLFEKYLRDDHNHLIAAMKAESTRRFNEKFTWENILSQYEKLLIQWYPREYSK
jgi:glycosyltransferase involved in cell wall biosynthesis